MADPSGAPTAPQVSYSPFEWLFFSLAKAPRPTHSLASTPLFFLTVPISPSPSTQSTSRPTEDDVTAAKEAAAASKLVFDDAVKSLRAVDKKKDAAAWEALDVLRKDAEKDFREKEMQSKVTYARSLKAGDLRSKYKKLVGRLTEQCELEHHVVRSADYFPSMVVIFKTTSATLGLTGFKEYGFISGADDATVKGLMKFVKHAMLNPASCVLPGARSYIYAFLKQCRDGGHIDNDIYDVLRDLCGNLVSEVRRRPGCRVASACAFLWGGC